MPLPRSRPTPQRSAPMRSSVRTPASPSRLSSVFLQSGRGPSSVAPARRQTRMPNTCLRKTVTADAASCRPGFATGLVIDGHRRDGGIPAPQTTNRALPQCTRHCGAGTPSRPPRRRAAALFPASFARPQWLDLDAILTPWAHHVGRLASATCPFGDSRRKARRRGLGAAGRGNKSWGSSTSRGECDQSPRRSPAPPSCSRQPRCSPLTPRLKVRSARFMATGKSAATRRPALKASNAR